MSGWFCVLRTDGAPVLPASAERMMSALRARGPDGESLHLAGSFALGLTVLDTRDRTPLSRQPARVGPYVAVGEVRIDAREDVARALGIGFADRVRMTDLELFVRAFQRWGDGVLTEVGGELAGCIVDERTREAVLFRDGFGVRQCFVAHVGPWLVASNSLGAVRRHEAVSSALDDDAILDFLLFDWIMDREKTAFVDIARLQPGHVMRVHNGRVRNVASWVLQLPPVDRKRSVDELGLIWRDALDTATAERRAERTSIFLSGGLDSTAIAASAVARGGTTGLHSITAVSTLGDDEDGRLAALTARHLGIAHQAVPSDALAGSEVLARTPLCTPEPTNDPFAWAPDRLFPAAAAHGPVVLDGEGGDEIWRAYSVRQLRARLPTATLAMDLLRSVARGVRPDFRTGLWARIRGVRGSHAEPPPDWIAARHAERAEARRAAAEAAMDWSTWVGERAIGAGTAQNPLWASATHGRDAEATGCAVDVRLPMLDRRVVAAALAVPSAPGATSKHAARVALRDRLPREILRRPKTGVGDVLLGRLNQDVVHASLRASPALGYYVDVERAIAQLDVEGEPASSNLRPIALARWLHGLGTL